MSICIYVCVLNLPLLFPCLLNHCRKLIALISLDKEKKISLFVSTGQGKNKVSMNVESKLKHFFTKEIQPVRL